MATALTGGTALSNDPAIEAARKDDVWLALSHGLHDFLLPSAEAVGREGMCLVPLEEAQESEQQDMAIIDLIVYDLLPLAPSEKIQKALLKIVSDTSMTLLKLPLVPTSMLRSDDAPPQQAAALRYYLADHSLSVLFELASLGGGSNGSYAEASRDEEGLGDHVAHSRPELPHDKALVIAKEAAPALVLACIALLEQFVRDEAEAASYPLPRARTEQVVSAARRLQQLELQPQVSQHLLRAVANNRHLSAVAHPEHLQIGRTKKRAHLLLLFAPMCRCITSNNPMLRDSLRVMLELVGYELGLAAGD